MGHLLFLVMHLFAIMFGFVFLFVTIPLHLIYAAFSSSGRASARAMARIAKKGDPTPKTHLICPDCKEFVRIGALVCKHCGAKFK